MKEKTILIATSNAGKVREMETAFRGLPVRLVPLSRLDALKPELGTIEEPVEDGATFMENARIKARYYRDKTGLSALADDSGLSVEALDGLRWMLWGERPVSTRRAMRGCTATMRRIIRS